jgi:hypothetical protein
MFEALKTWVAMGANPLLYEITTLTNAQILALRATPQQLVAAPGAGKVLIFDSCILMFDRTAAYTESTANLTVKYENGTGLAASEAIEATGFADAAADIVTTGRRKIDLLGLASATVNKALVLHNIGAGEWGAGNAANVIRVKTMYTVWKTDF